MWYYNFEDYKLYCNLTNQKASRYKSLLDYKRFLEYLKGIGVVEL